jgi:hypothetical protein
MPFDSDDESNVLVPSPNKGSEQKSKTLESEKLTAGTKTLFSNKFGSTFKVLPEARDRSAPGTGGESRGLSGVAGKVHGLDSLLIIIREESLSGQRLPWAESLYRRRLCK